MSQSSRLITMVEIAIMTAIAVVLDKLTLFKMPQGGSVTLVMIPIAVLAFRRGWMAGVTGGLLTGILLMMFGGYVVHPVQAILDYPAAFAVLGLAGWFGLKENQSRKTKLVIAGSGLLLAGAFRLLTHFLSGVIFFAEYAPKGQSVYMYSFVYNITYILPGVLLSFLAMMLMIYTAPQLVFRQR
ncbi:energy-coupled thiamine transporter ThiT [Paenactinomyces guangxiensis]|uniref:Energy-coupled thiamine transporter ThiT n=1 Tax=Paenactinomyces guangxiensis TaxID=1490290 RepID=A0A7W1WRR9_9BACL|nr:energy-coupled thiamine transporter ThiT [Paenactinomyces guangxiensis]MBA4494759.1 energy-coupled thiamine transporter ThiT [Paenactinomyces guangxiensis]MBH8591843.1 energy-coupled thiamine transporter ThiT [Paenactinomyces guangxiensis]